MISKFDVTNLTFNETVSELRKRLVYTFESSSGERYYYEGVMELLFKMIGFLGEGKDKI